MIQDGVERRIVKRARSSRLSRPGLCTSIVDVDRVGVVCISVHDVDGVEKLCKIAGRIHAVEGTITKLSLRILDAMSKRKRKTDGRPVVLMSVALVAARRGEN